MNEASRISLDEAVELTRTGDLWLFRGGSLADQAIRAFTNAPVNHVGMAVVLDDLPPLMWHAELGKGLMDVWTGSHHRGVQLHDLRAAATQWMVRYEQRAWLRQLSGDVTKEMEDALLKTIARMDGLPFPSTMGRVGRVSNYYDPGKFWSVDDLELGLGASLGGEIEVHLPGKGRLW